MAIARWLHRATDWLNRATPKTSRRPPAPRLSLLALEGRALPSGTGIVDPGFESAALTAGAFKYAPTGSAWTFGGTAGITANGSGFTAGNPGAPQGGEVAFLQKQGAVSQSVSFAAGTYTISFAAAQRGNVASIQTFQVLVDNQVVGTFNTLAGGGYATLTTSSFTVGAGNHTITFQGTNLFGGDNTIFLDQVSLNQQTTGLTDSGFEGLAVKAGGFAYAPTGSLWTFTGPAGVAANAGGFTSGNPNTPQGNQVAFLQQNGSVSQAVAFPAGTYTLSFSAAQRGNVASLQTLQVLVDGKVVGTFNNLAGTAYTTLTTSSFTVTAGSHTVTIKGTNLFGGDNTVLIDQITVNKQATGLTDSGFETAAPGAGGFAYNPAGSGWTFTGPAGVAGNGSGFTAGNPGAPQGNQVAFLQQNGSASQSLTLPAGTYTLSFSAAQRANVASAQTLQVLVDGQIVGTFNSLTGAGYTTVTTSSFTAADGSHTVTFQGTNLNGGDNTLLIDQVTVNRQTAGLNDSGFESVPLAPGAFAYNPTGSAWTFNGPAGVSDNGSGFTAGNPGAPQGDQVAFLQQQGSASQTLTLAAGTYTISFAAAQRGNVASAQTFQVLVDGNVIGVVNNLTGAGYSTATTSSFTLADGSHTVTFQGTNLNGGDNTVLIDQVRLNSE